MNETLYIVAPEEGRSRVVGAVTRNSSNMFIYQPVLTNANTSDVGIQVTTKPPLLITSRTYSPRRKDLPKLLARHGLQEFDAWELVKRTEGRLATDNINFLTKEKVMALGLELPNLEQNVSLVSSVIKDKNVLNQAKTSFLPKLKKSRVRKLGILPVVHAASRPSEVVRSLKPVIVKVHREEDGNVCMVLSRGPVNDHKVLAEKHYRVHAIVPDTAGTISRPLRDSRHMLEIAEMFPEKTRVTRRGMQKLNIFGKH